MKALTHAETFPCAKSVVGQLHTEKLRWQYGLRDRETGRVR